jgi:hypothetical protein
MIKLGSEAVMTQILLAVLCVWGREMWCWKAAYDEEYENEVLRKMCVLREIIWGSSLGYSRVSSCVCVGGSCDVRMVRCGRLGWAGNVAGVDVM